MAFLRCVQGGGTPTPPSPAWFAYVDITPVTSTDTITVPYDNTKTLLNVLIYANVPTYTSNYMQTGLCGHKKVNDSNMIRLGATATDYQGNDVFSGNYGSITVDDVNGTVTLVGRGGSYVFKHDVPYRVILLYADAEAT